ncbi:selenoprotein S [Nilaparvata lugens]|uniref:selenoprotein S n=1 Tax=Nilaparvata lugens TaxID=108931 RepID=UPI00193DF0BA|nr:selenoprotein S [Nilaparvata lugens]
MEEYEHPDTLEETAPKILTDGIDTGLGFLSQYGWYLALGVLTLIAFRTKIENALYDIYEARQKRQYEEKCKKDPDFARQRQQAIEAARKKMQDELDRKAKEAAEKQKEREEKKRQEFLDSTKDQGGNKLGSSDDKGSSSSSKKLANKPEYFPLMGGYSSGYRAPRRSCCPSSGGCG